MNAYMRSTEVIGVDYGRIYALVIYFVSYIMIVDLN